MTSTRRWWLWLPLLGTAAWLTLFGDRPADGSAAALSIPVQRPAPASPVAPASARVTHPQKPGPEPEPIEALVIRGELAPSARTVPVSATAASGQDLFSPRSWNPPAPPVSVVVAAPVAPPLPFVYLGKKIEGEVWEVYLSRAEQTFIARVGQTLDATYRVDSIAPPSLVLTYLPLGQSQTLPIGDSR